METNKTKKTKEERKEERISYKKTGDYTYVGNSIVNNTPRPKKNFLIVAHVDIYNNELKPVDKITLMCLCAELPNTENIFDTKKLCRKLGIKIDSLNDSLERLKQLNYIYIDNNKITILKTGKQVKTANALNKKMNDFNKTA